ncbi:DsbC family protein [uncultured Agitococcus sp.]|uniref:DsbC family protein n=1 Tax=uncultured Agitococcus sp. TaxID=1506599 RepID=UPI002635DBBC|nr:DsbC family protein [uncultured Agitococcus sp.]
MIKFSHLALSLSLVMTSACSQAEPPVAADNKKAVTTVSSAEQSKVEEVIRANLKSAIPDAEITSVKQSVAGLYEIKAKGYGTAYMTADGRYMIQGEVIELNGAKLTNITEQGMAAHRKELLASVPLKDMVIFPAANGKAKGVAYVFTDVDCGYCRKIHEEIPVLSQMGIEIRYLAFPRAGYPSPTSQKMDAIWCATDRNAAMTAMKRNQPVTPASCQNPIKQQYELGQEVGVRGTPAVFLEDGTQVGGYLSAKDMAALMKIK